LCARPDWHMNAGDATSRPRFCFADVNDALPLSGSRLSVPDLRSPGPGFELGAIHAGRPRV